MGPNCLRNLCSQRFIFVLTCSYCAIFFFLLIYTNPIILRNLMNFVLYYKFFEYLICLLVGIYVGAQIIRCVHNRCTIFSIIFIFIFPLDLYSVAIHHANDPMRSKCSPKRIKLMICLLFPKFSFSCPVLIVICTSIFPKQVKEY